MPSRAQDTAPHTPPPAPPLWWQRVEAVADALRLPPHPTPGQLARQQRRDRAHIMADWIIWRYLTPGQQDEARAGRLTFTDALRLARAQRRQQIADRHRQLADLDETDARASLSMWIVAQFEA